jgi:metal-responsive CopG/Arc/MetJ family transcriptional regulator
MSKKVIQVPIDDDLLAALDGASRAENRKRAGLIRRACREYLSRHRREMLDRIYQEGYERVPEDGAVADAQVAQLESVLGEETW